MQSMLQSLYFFTENREGACWYGKKKSFRARLAKNIRKNWILYVMILPVVIYYIVFAYAPHVWRTAGI